MATSIEDHRQPLAWQHLDYRFSHHERAAKKKHSSDNISIVPVKDHYAQNSSTSDRLSHRTERKIRDPRDIPKGGSTIPSLSPPTETTETSSESSESCSEEIIETRRMVEPMVPYPPTLRSSRSVPMLTLPTWDGEPCPVHGMALPNPNNIYGMLPPLPAPPPPPPQPIPTMPQMPLPPLPPPYLMPQYSATLPNRKALSIYEPRPLPPMPALPPPEPMYGTLPMIGAKSLDRRSLPPSLLPPMMRPRPFVVPAANIGLPEPLPIRDPEKGKSVGSSSPSLTKEKSQKGKKIKCCRGPLLVLWIILGVIGFGILLGIVLNLTVH